MKKKLIYFLICVVILIMPLLTNNGIIDSIRSSADMKAHIGVITGENTYTLYAGQTILKYLFYPFAENDNLDTIYLWFSFLILIACAFTLYYIVKKLVNNISALLVIPMAIFCSVGIFALFTYGVIFNIVSMYIILPLAILFSVRWLCGKGIWNIILGILLFVLFGVFHATSLYLPFIIIIALVIYIIYAWKTHKLKTLIKVLPYSIGLVVMNILLSSKYIGVANYKELSLGNIVMPSLPTVLSPSLPTVPSQSLPIIPSPSLSAVSPQSLLIIISYLSVIVILFAIAIYQYLKWRKEIVIGNQTRVFLLILVSMIIALGGGVFLISMFWFNSVDILWFNRITLDLSTVIAIITACLAGIIIQSKKSPAFNALIFVLLGIGVIPTLIYWLK